MAKVIIENLPAVAQRDHKLNIATTAWDKRSEESIDYDGCAVIHVGSGRQLEEVIRYCEQHGLPLIQGATGVDEELLPDKPSFILIDAPNLSIPIVKLFALLDHGKMFFRDFDIRIVESHQSTKTSLAGTARTMANLLGAPAESVVAVRDQTIQRVLLGVPESALGGHAIHRIEIEGLGATISISTKVFGRETYLHGIIRVLSRIDNLSAGSYLVTDLVNKGLI